MTGPRSIKTRGDRRPSVKVERDKLVAAEGVVAGKTSVEIGRDLGVSRATASRLASQGLREAMESGDNLDVKKLFNLVVTSFTEVLEDIDATIKAYKSAGKQIPTRVLTTKINAGLAIAKTCGFGPETIVTGREYKPPVINIIVGDDGNEWLKLEPGDTRRADMSNNDGRFVRVPKRLPAPVADAEVVEPQ